MTPSGESSGVHGNGDNQPGSAPPGLSIALSTIIAAIWAGLWGFNWAASHLPAGALFVAIIVGLAGGIGLTAYIIDQTFSLLRSVIQQGPTSPVSLRGAGAPPGPIPPIQLRGGAPVPDASPAAQDQGPYVRR